MRLDLPLADDRSVTRRAKLTDQRTMERGSGVALWRQIVERVRQGIADGSLVNAGKLQPEMSLAALFGVNRHTVRSAIAALVQEGCLYVEQGRGTFVRDMRRISYALGPRTRFSANLEGQARESRTTLLVHAIVEVNPQIADVLGMATGDHALRMDLLGEADGKKISRATHWFSAIRFPDLLGHYHSTGSITSALSRCGIMDYIRRSTSVSARYADAPTLADLALAPGAIVLVTTAINETPQGEAFQFSETLFPADRVELMVS